MSKSPAAGDALLHDERISRYSKSLEDFWDEEGRRRLAWFRPYGRLYQWDLPNAKWFLGGLTNACFNCVDRHVEDGYGGKVAYWWEAAAEGDRRALTFGDLQREVVRLAIGLKGLGVRKGTRVAIYMGLVPELPIAMLACARIGAPHIVVSAREAADSLADRLTRTGSSVLITQDEALWHGRAVPLKKVADRAMSASGKIAKTVVLRRTGGAVSMKQDRDVWWQHLTAGANPDPRSCPCEPMDSEDLLFVMFSNGAGVMHTTAGYLVGTATTHEYVLDVKDETAYRCTADIASIAGHSYGVYGALCNRTTSLICEAAPGDPNEDRHTWLQTETGMIVLGPLVGLLPPKRGSVGVAFPGVDVGVCDDRGRPVAAGSAGHLVIRSPYPAMLRGLYGEPERYRRAYWEQFPGVFFTGERARVDADGDYWIVGGRNGV